MLTVEFAKTIEDVEKIRSAWMDLNWHPNADIDWFLTVANNRAEVIRPYIITVLKEGQPTLILIGRIEYTTLDIKFGYKQIWTPRLLTLSVVYGGILRKDEDELPVRRVMTEIQNMISRCEVELVVFNHLRTDSYIHHLAVEISSHRYKENPALSNLHWRISLPDSATTYFGSLKQKTRKNLRRALRHLEAKYPGKTEIKCFQKTKDLEIFITDAEKIAKKTYQHVLSEGFADFEAYYKKLIYVAAQRNSLLAFILYIEEIPVAYDWGTLYGKIFYWHAGGYDPEYSEIEPGTNLFVHIINEIFKYDINKVDFGFGDAFYKHMYCNESWNEESVYLFAPKPKTLCMKYIRSTMLRMNKFGESVLRRTGLLNKIKKYWRQTLPK